MVKNVALRGLNSSSPLLATVSNDYQKANKLAELLEKMTNEDLLLVTGSLYFVSEVRELLLAIGGRNG